MGPHAKQACEEPCRSRAGMQDNREKVTTLACC
jgi:hypothetical protein